MRISNFERRGSHEYTDVNCYATQGLRVESSENITNYVFRKRNDE